MIQEAGLYIVPENRMDRLWEVSADAFQNYPLYKWFSNGKIDPIAISLTIKAAIEPMADESVIYADSEEINGFIVWTSCGFTGSKPLSFMKNGGVQLVKHSGLGIIQRLLVYENLAINQKKKYTDPKDWYLYNICIKRNMQRKGVGRKLILPMLELCDNEKKSVYLETNKEENVTMYEYLGFELKETNLIPGSNVNHYSMLRTPG